MRRFNFILLKFLIVIAISVKCKRIQIEKNIVNNSKLNYLQNVQLLSADNSQNQSFEPFNLARRQEIINMGDLQYIGQVYIGQDTIPFKFILDTGSTKMWIPGSNCTNVSNHCHIKRIYDYKSSTTATIQKDKKVEIQYGKGKCEGYPGTELIKLSQEDKQFQVDLLFTYNDKDMDGMQAHGIIGLSNSKELNYLEYAADQGAIQSSIFAFELKQYPELSYFYYDDIPEQKTQDLVQVNAVHEQRWLVDIIGTYLDGEDYSDISYNRGLIDTGSSFMHISQSLYNKLINYAKNICNYQYREYICTCDVNELNKNLPTIKFYIRGGILEIKPEDYIFRQGYLCYLGIEPLKDFNFVILGDVLLRKYFTVFDKRLGRIGFGDVENKLYNYKTVVNYILLPIFSVFTLLGLILVIYKRVNYKTQENNSLNQHLLSTNIVSNNNDTHFKGRSVRVGSSVSAYSEL